MFNFAVPEKGIFFCSLHRSGNIVDWHREGFLLDLRDSVAWVYFDRSFCTRQFAKNLTYSPSFHFALRFKNWSLKRFLCLLFSSPFSASFFSASSLAGWSTFHENTNSYKFTRVTLSKHSRILVIWGYQKAVVNQFTLFFWRYTVSKAVARCMWQ